MSKGGEPDPPVKKSNGEKVPSNVWTLTVRWKYGDLPTTTYERVKTSHRRGLFGADLAARYNKTSTNRVEQNTV